jgi:hypothetical protein
MEGWIAKAVETAGLSLLQLAELSTEKALSAFTWFFASVAGLSLLLFIASDRFFEGAGQHVLSMVLVVCAYIAGSLNAWRRKREEILHKIVTEAAKDTINYVKFFALLAAAVLIFVTLLSEYAGSYAFENFGPLGGFIIVGVLIIIAAVWVASAVSLVFTFGPALVALAYLWISIYLAKGCLVVGSRRLVNALILYAVFGSVYFVITSFPELRESLHVPSICR